MPKETGVAISNFQVPNLKSEYEICKSFDEQVGINL